MTDGAQWFDELSFPVLLRGARATYVAAIQAALAAAECDDLPRNGTYVVGAISREGSQLSQIIRELGVSKQALTERGRAAAAAARTAIERVDADLAARVGAEHLAHARATLAALMAAGHHEHDHDHDHQHDHEHEHEHAV